MATPKATKAPATPAAPKAPGTDAMAAVRAARNTATQNDRLTFKADLVKGAPQAKKIVEILKGAGAKGMTRAELVAGMKGQVVTRQPESRILAYYEKDLVTAGAITVDKAAQAAPAPVATATVATAPVAA